MTDEIEMTPEEVAAAEAALRREADRTKPSTLTKSQEEDLVAALTKSEAARAKERERAAHLVERGRSNAVRLREEAVLRVQRARQLAERLSMKRDSPTLTDLKIVLAFLEGELAEIPLPPMTE
jgi:hypothetical protein